MRHDLAPGVSPMVGNGLQTLGRHQDKADQRTAQGIANLIGQGSDPGQVAAIKHALQSAQMVAMPAEGPVGGLSAGSTAAKTEGYLVHFGKGPETAEGLAEQAAKAEAKGFPHGVSTKLKDKISGTDKLHRSATKSEVENAFEVKQTGADPSHHTVVLPKPVTQATTEKFNTQTKRNTMKDERRVDSTEAFEWYDGLVLGLARIEDLQFLVCLLAFDPDANCRRYLLAHVSQEQADKLRTIFKTGGPQAFDRQVLSEILAQSINLYLTRSEPEQSKTVVLAPATTAQRARLSGLSFPLIDNAVVKGSITDWLDD